MSRKLILSLAAIATLASAGLVSGAADAMVVNRGNNLRPPVFHPGHPHFHDHVHITRIYGRTFVRPVGYVERVAEPGPCTCLTKGYTPDGTVVFKDLCTKEMASAPVEGAAEKTGEAESPSNFAGKTYQDYVAANPQNQGAQQQKN
jgi:hypothetical protein